jgi:ATP-binding cassette, subfamily B, bacterial
VTRRLALVLLVVAAGCKDRPVVPVVSQTSIEDDCAAALTAVLARHGRKVALADIRALTNIGPGGTCNAQAMVETAQRYGLSAKGVMVNRPEELELLPEPSILHWSDEPAPFPRGIDGAPGRFVVYEGGFRDLVTVMDPKKGRVWLPREELFRHFTGVALLFEP